MLAETKFQLAAERLGVASQTLHSPSLSASFTLNMSTEMACADSHLDIPSIDTIISALLMHTYLYLLEIMDMTSTCLRCYLKFLLFKIPTTHRAEPYYLLGPDRYSQFHQLASLG